MSTSGSSIPVLISAFTLGIVVAVGSASLLLHVSNHGKTVFQDGQRLVLALFLLSVALWAQFDFISIAINTNASTACQVGVIANTLFDQLGRFSLELFLVWASDNETQSGIQHMIPQIVMTGRFILGIVFVGLSRPQFQPVCVPKSSVLALAIVVIIFDAIIIALVTIRSFMSGLVTAVKAGRSNADQGKAVLLVLASFALWTAMSITMLLATPGITLLLRTLLPSIGLLLLLAVVTLYSEQLTTTKTRSSRAPESPVIREISTAQTATSSEYPPSRYEDLKENEILSTSAFERPREAPRPDAPRQSHYQAPDAANTILPVPPIPQTARRTSRPQAARGMRSLMDLKGGPAAGIASGRVKISNPILQANGDQNPLNKIPTISLDDAVKIEQERRANDLLQDYGLSTQRPTPQEFSAEESMRRATSLKRKLVAASVASHNTIFPSASDLMPVAVTTSSQLSPGAEDVRRRSPRQQAMGNSTSIQAFVPSPIAPEPQRRFPQQQQEPAEPVAIQEPSVPRPPIRPSRQIPPSPKSPQTAKTPLQRRPTTGLPGNPRAAAFKAPRAEATENQRQQTIMFINKIVYDNPGEVEDIMQDVNVKGRDPRASVVSIVNRPRPIPRKIEEDRNIFPAESFPYATTHRRTKSGGSIMERKSILRATAGDPPQLPPLPPPPKIMVPHLTGRDANRPLPNNTKSMTFDEKMTLLFPAHPVPTTDVRTRRRSSSMPDVPRLPEKFVAQAMANVDGSNRVTRGTSTSERSSKNLLKVDKLPSKDSQAIQERHHSAADDVGSSWLPIGIDIQPPSLEDDSKYKTDIMNDKRASSPVLPPVRDSIMTMSTDLPIQDNATRWGSVHSSVVVMPIQANVKVPLPMYVRGDRKGATQIHHKAPVARLGESKDGKTDAKPAQGKQQLQWYRRVGDELLTFSERKDKMRSRKMPPPTPLILGRSASSRRFQTRAQEPSPLESPEQALALIQAQLKKFEEATMALNDSPGQRLELLNNLEKEMNVQVDHWHDMQHDLGRDSLSTMQTVSPLDESRRQSLASMGTMDKTFSFSPRRSSLASRRRSRRSALADSIVEGVSPIGTTGLSATLAVMPEFTAAAGWQRRLAEAQAQFAESANYDGMSQRRTNFLSKFSLGSPTPPESDCSSDSEIEERQRQAEKIDNVIATATEAAKKIVTARQSLWTPPTSLMLTPSTGMLWTPAEPKVHESADLPALFAKAMSFTGRPSSGASSHRSTAKRNTCSSLPEIKTFSLWSKDEVTAGEATRPSTGLWKPPVVVANLVASPFRRTSEPELVRRNVQPQGQVDEFELELEEIETPKMQKAPRPLTQRPPRRSRRISALPDIIENPEPLPNKRDTLGIFQFAWGERSDTATIQPYNVPRMPMPGTMSSGIGLAISAALEARSRQLEDSENSTSFFDEYDEEDELDLEVQDSDEEILSDSDDDFDESTLWEIASLLKSEHVPSKLSLLPPPLPMEPVEEEEEELGSDEILSDDDFMVGEDFGDTEIFVAMDPDMVDNQKEEPASSLLWTSPEAELETAAKQNVSLLQPDEATWKSYNINEASTARSKPRIFQPATIESTELWMTETTEVATSSQTSSQLWSAASVKTRELIPKPTKIPVLQPEAVMLWAPLPKNIFAAGSKDSKIPRLFDKNAAAEAKMQMAVVRTTDKEPAALHMSRIPRASKIVSLEKITSTSLWTATIGQKAFLWAPRPAPVATLVKAGFLFDKEVVASQKFLAPIRTTDMEPAALYMTRRPRVPKHVGLDKLMSTSLWTSPSERKSMLWKPLPKSAAIPVKTGFLFDKEVAAAQKLRAPIRSTTKEPAALHMPRKPRKVNRQSLEQLISSQLWQPSQQGRAVTMLWTPKAVVAMVQAQSHLFDLEAALAEKQLLPIRTTDKEPVATQMVRKARKTISAPLEELVSTSLWQPLLQGRKALWAPKAKMVFSALEAQEHLFDLQVALAQKQLAPTYTTDMEPVAVRMVRVQSRSLARLSMLRLTTSSLWSVETAAPKQHQRNWITAGTVTEVTEREVEEVEEAAEAAVSDEELTAAVASRSIRKTPLVESAEDWDAALQQALLASYPPLRRISATPSQWQAALSTAVARSFPFDVARKHPALAGLTVSEDLECDVSKVHPAFFSMIERVEETTVETIKEMPELIPEMLEETAPETTPEMVVEPIVDEFALIIPQEPVEPAEPALSVQTTPQPQAMPAQDEGYYSYIQAMENEAIMRLRMLEGGAP